MSAQIRLKTAVKVVEFLASSTNGDALFLKKTYMNLLVHRLGYLECMIRLVVEFVIVVKDRSKVRSC